MIKEKITQTYHKKEDIDEIIKNLKNIKYDELHKPSYYEWSLLRKNTDEEKIKEIYSQFNKIGLINKRILKYGDISYDLYYELEDKTYIVIAICTEKKRLINAFHTKTNFQSFKKQHVKKTNQ